MKKIKIPILLTLVACILFYPGCSNPEYELVDQNTKISIYDVNNREIGSIECYQYSILAGSCILYNRLTKKYPEAFVGGVDEVEYHMYDIETKKDYKLSTIKDWGYEESHEAIIKDDHLYLGIATGEYANLDKCKQIIYDIDIFNHKMSPMLEVEGGIPYNSYTIVNDRLILAELLHNGHTNIIECNINGEEDYPIIHDYDESKEFTSDSIRHIYSDENFIYMMRLHIDENDKSFLYLDKYDLNLNLISSLDVSESCVPDKDESEEDIQNNRRQFIGHFFVHNDIFLYRNFSINFFVGKLNNDNKPEEIFSDDFLDYVTDPYQDKNTDLFTYSLNEDQNKRNSLYKIDTKTQKLSVAKFYADDSRYLFFGASRNDKNMILLTMCNFRETERDPDLPDRLYYISMNDLTFEPYRADKITL